MAHPKSVSQYEKESVRVGECLVHPSHGAAKRVYEKRHRVELTYPSQVLCHSCDNPKCILDEHHFIGSQKENVQDSVRKGRHSIFSDAVKSAGASARRSAAEEGRYSGNGGYVEGTPALLDSEVMAIKRLAAEGKTTREIQQITLRSQSTIDRVKRGEYDSGVKRGSRNVGA